MQRITICFCVIAFFSLTNCDRENFNEVIEIPEEVTPAEVEALCDALRADPAPDGEPALGPAAEGWSFDLSLAPSGGERVLTGKVAGVHEFERRVPVRERVFAAGTGGVVTVSYWIPEYPS